MNEMLKQFHNATYPQLFGMMFGLSCNNLNIRNVILPRFKGHSK